MSSNRYFSVAYYEQSIMKNTKICELFGGTFNVVEQKDKEQSVIEIKVSKSRIRWILWCRFKKSMAGQLVKSVWEMVNREDGIYDLNFEE